MEAENKKSLRIILTLTMLVVPLVVLSAAIIRYYLDKSAGAATTTNVSTLNIDGAPQAFTDIPYIDNATSEVRVPITEIFTKLGIDLNYFAGQNRYLGGYNRSSIAIPINEKVAYFDSVAIDLEHATDTFIDLDFIDDIYGIEVLYSSDKTTVDINHVSYNGFDDEDNYAAKIAGLTGGKPMLTSPSINNMGSVCFNTPTAKCFSQRVPVAGQAFTEAVQNESYTKNFNALHDSQIQYKLAASINPGDLLVASFYARTVATDDLYGNAHARIGVQRNGGGGGTANYNDTIDITGDWQKFIVTINTTGMSGQLVVNDRLYFHLAYDVQTIQFADMQLTNYGNSVTLADLTRTTYRGQQYGALWRDVAQRRIEKYRKSDIDVVVKNDHGKPIDGAEVSVEMIKNDFLVGTAIYTPSLGAWTEYGENLPYFEEIFVPMNAFKWTTFEKDICNNQPYNADYFYNWVTSKNAPWRGHNLIWDRVDELPAFSDYVTNCTTNNPIDWNTISETDAVKLISDRITKILTDYPGATWWDLWNEPITRNLLQKRFGAEFFVQFFNLAKSLAPNTKFYITDEHFRGNYDHAVDGIIDIFNELKAKGVAVDGMGVQGHVLSAVYPQLIFNQMEAVSPLVGEMSVTEYDAEFKDEDLSADYLRDYMILTYSQPKMKSFITWNYVDAHDGSRSLLLRRNMTKKPAYFAMEDNINSWKTNAYGLADDSGAYSVRGHNGLYRITAKCPDGSSESVEYHTGQGATNATVICPVKVAVPGVPDTGERLFNDVLSRRQLVRRLPYVYLP
jgi:GH35 family endo-1,4-beta-xylanase